jgi:hypothetical protein
MSSEKYIPQPLSSDVCVVGFIVGGEVVGISVVGFIVGGEVVGISVVGFLVGGEVFLVGDASLLLSLTKR